MRQAELLAERLKNEDITAIYASNLQRSTVTAEKVAAFHGLPVNSAPLMRELNFGIWEGYTFKEMAEKWPKELSEWRRSPFTVSPPEGETLYELRDRTSLFLKETAQKHPEGNILVVTHAGTIRAILATMLRLKGDLYWKFKISNTSITIIDYDGKSEFQKSNAYIIGVNDTYHIK